MGTLKIDLRPGESVRIGDIAVVTLEEKSGKASRLAIQADKSVPIKRVRNSSAAQFAAAGGITGEPYDAGVLQNRTRASII